MASYDLFYLPQVGTMVVDFLLWSWPRNAVDLPVDVELKPEALALYAPAMFAQISVLCRIAFWAFGACCGWAIWREFLLGQRATLGERFRFGDGGDA